MLNSLAERAVTGPDGTLGRLASRLVAREIAGGRGRAFWHYISKRGLYRAGQR